MRPKLGKLDDETGGGGHLHLDGYNIGHPCDTIDLTTEGASLTVDGVSFTVPAGAFEANSKADKFKYEYKAKDHGNSKDKFKWKLELDTKKGRFKFKADYLDVSAISPADGLSVKLALGDEAGQQNVAVTSKDKKLEHWKYHADHKTLCNVNVAPGDECGGDDDGENDQ